MQSFGRWAPDTLNVNSGLAGEALGVRPGLTGYRPWPQLASSSPALETPATAGRGAFAARTTANAIAIFVGQITKLRKFAGVATNFTNVTRSSAVAYALATDDQWQFAQFGVNVFATQITDALQFIDASSGTNFEPVTGSPPKARYIAVVGDFLMLGNTDTSSREVRWSGRNDASSWTKYVKDADAQTFPDGGDVMGLSGFERGGLVFQTEIVRQMATRQDAAIFEFHRVESSQGTLAPYSIITRQGLSYYYAVNGFQRIGSDGASEAIATNWIDGWFLENSNASTRPKAIIGSADPASPEVYWLFAGPGNATSNILDHALCFNPSLTDSDYGPWTHAPLSASTIFPAATTATTLENLGSAGLGYTLETVPYSLDADIWKGGAPRLGAFDSAFKMAFFSGSPAAATVQTAQFEPVPSRRGYVRGFRLIGDAANATGRVGYSDRPQTPITWNGSQAMDAGGRIQARAEGRLIQVEVSVPAGDTWRHLAGIDFDDDQVTPTGRRGTT